MYDYTVPGPCLDTSRPEFDAMMRYDAGAQLTSQPAKKRSYVPQSDALSTCATAMSDYHNGRTSFCLVAKPQKALYPVPSLVSIFHGLSLLICLSRLLSLILFVQLPFSLIWKTLLPAKEAHYVFASPSRWKSHSETSILWRQPQRMTTCPKASCLRRKALLTSKGLPFGVAIETCCWSR